MPYHQIPDNLPNFRDSDAITVAPPAQNAAYRFVRSHQYGDKYFYVGWKGDPAVSPNYGSEYHIDGWEVRYTTDPGSGVFTQLDYFASASANSNFWTYQVGKYLFLFTQKTQNSTTAHIAIYNMATLTRIYYTDSVAYQNYVISGIHWHQAICHRTKIVGNSEEICFYIAVQKQDGLYTQYPTLITYYAVHDVDSDTFTITYHPQTISNFPTYLFDGLPYDYIGTGVVGGHFIDYNLSPTSIQVIDNTLYYFMTSLYADDYIAYDSNEKRHWISLCFKSTIPAAYGDDLDFSSATQITLHEKFWTVAGGWDSSPYWATYKNYVTGSTLYLFEYTTTGLNFRLSNILDTTHTITKTVSILDDYYILEDDLPDPLKTPLSLIYFPCGPGISNVNSYEVGVHSYNTTSFTVLALGGYYGSDIRELYTINGVKYYNYTPLVKVYYDGSAFTFTLLYNGYNLTFDYPDLVKEDPYTEDEFWAIMTDPDVIFNSDPIAGSFGSQWSVYVNPNGDDIMHLTWVFGGASSTVPVLSDTLIMADRVSVIRSTQRPYGTPIDDDFSDLVASAYCANWKTVDNSSPLETTLTEEWYIREV